MGRLFGTDGVRGVANRDLTPELAFQLGRVGAHILMRKKGLAVGSGRIVIGGDTRVSGEMLEAALVAGITSAGVQAELLGVTPTPGVAHLTRKLEADAGVMISASHNPVADNGIKFFDHQGYKLTDEVEDEIESFLTVERSREIGRPVGVEVGRVFRREGVGQEYIKFLTATTSQSFAGMTVVLDCAFGATYATAPQVFTELGANVIAIHAENDGSRINVRCGSTYPLFFRKKWRVGEHRLVLPTTGTETGSLLSMKKGNWWMGTRLSGSAAYNCWLKAAYRSKPSPLPSIVTWA